MARPYTQRRNPFTVYTSEYNRLSSRGYSMKHPLMSESEFATAYIHATKSKLQNPSKLLANKSRAITFKQGQHLQAVMYAQTGVRTPIADIMKNPKGVDWKFVQNVSAQWS